MKQYLVQWVINLSASNPHDAAVRAAEIALDPTTTATVWEVEDDEGYDSVFVDLYGEHPYPTSTEKV